MSEEVEEVKKRLRRYEVPFLGNQAYVVFNAIVSCARLADMNLLPKPEPENALLITVIGAHLYPLYREGGWKRVQEECEFLVKLFEQAPSFRELLLRIVRGKGFRRVVEFCFKLWELKKALRDEGWSAIVRARKELGDDAYEWIAVL